MTSILVVDDERAIRHLLSTVLSREGHAVTAVREMADAIRAITDETFDLILTDIVLGSQTGLDLLAEARVRRPRTPVVLITGHPTVETAARAVRQGAFDYLVKPVSRERLLQTVKVALRHRAALQREAALEAELRRQKQLYQRVVEDQAEMICRFTPDGTLTFVNRAYADQFGIPADRLVGTRIFDLTPESDHDAMRASIGAMRPDQPVSSMEHRVRLPDGEIRWHSWQDRALFDDAGCLTELQSVGRDITARKAAEASLERSQAELETVFQTIPEGILTVDGDLRVVRKNRALDAICPAFLHDPTAERDPAVCNAECIRVLTRTVETRSAVREYHTDCDATSPPRRLVLNCVPLSGRRGQGQRALLVVRDITRLRDLEEKLQERESMGRIIGGSEPMQRVHTLIRQLADLDNTVLITGESGTGKELVVEALHHGGARAAGPLIRVNCAALPDELLGSELFGHVRGAFTGAVRDRVGRFQAADGGTLFLDEIGDLPLHIQLKLLRVLERKEIERVGDNRTLTADVRIVAATHVDLRQRVAEGRFREDFYYRLNVITIPLPPLRDRPSDIPLLVSHFRRHYGRAFHKRFTGITSDAMDRLLSHTWPGNVRELKHVIERACILSPGGRLDLASVGELTPLTPTPTPTPERIPGADNGPAAAQSDADQIAQILHRTDGNKAKAARILGISRSTLYRRLRRNHFSRAGRPRSQDGQ